MISRNWLLIAGSALVAVGLAIGSALACTPATDDGAACVSASNGRVFEFGESEVRELVFANICDTDVLVTYSWKGDFASTKLVPATDLAVIRCNAAKCSGAIEWGAVCEGESKAGEMTELTVEGPAIAVEALGDNGPTPIPEVETAAAEDQTVESETAVAEMPTEKPAQAVAEQVAVAESVVPNPDAPPAMPKQQAAKPVRPAPTAEAPTQISESRAATEQPEPMPEAKPDAKTGAASTPTVATGVTKPEPAVEPEPVAEAPQPEPEAEAEAIPPQAELAQDEPEGEVVEAEVAVLESDLGTPKVAKATEEPSEPPIPAQEIARNPVKDGALPTGLSEPSLDKMLIGRWQAAGKADFECEVQSTSGVISIDHREAPYLYSGHATVDTKVDVKNGCRLKTGWPSAWTYESDISLAVRGDEIEITWHKVTEQNPGGTSTFMLEDGKLVAAGERAAGNGDFEEVLTKE